MITIERAVRRITSWTSISYTLISAFKSTRSSSNLQALVNSAESTFIYYVCISQSAQLPSPPQPNSILVHTCYLQSSSSRLFEGVQARSLREGPRGLYLNSILPSLPWEPATWAENQGLLSFTTFLLQRWSLFVYYHHSLLNIARYIQAQHSFSVLGTGGTPARRPHQHRRSSASTSTKWRQASGYSDRAALTCTHPLLHPTLLPHWGHSKASNRLQSLKAWPCAERGRV